MENKIWKTFLYKKTLYVAVEYTQIKENPLGLGLLNSHANEASKRYHRNKKIAD